MNKKILLPIVLLALSLLVIFPMGMSAGASSQTMAGHSLQASGFGEYLSEYNTGEVLYQHNADAKHEIASMVKIMTANLIFDAIDEGKLSYDEMITISKEEIGRAHV